jgi:hypothetical protein
MFGDALMRALRGRTVAVVVATALMTFTAGCSGASGKDKNVSWDLRKPTTVGQLGATITPIVEQRAPHGRVLNVDIALPDGVTIVGPYQNVIASNGVLPVSMQDIVSELHFFLSSQNTADELIAVLDRFEKEWGVAAQEIDGAAALASFRSTLGEAFGSNGALEERAFPKSRYYFEAPGVGSVGARLTIQIGLTWTTAELTVRWDPNSVAV